MIGRFSQQGHASNAGRRFLKQGEPFTTNLVFEWRYTSNVATWSSKAHHKASGNRIGVVAPARTARPHPLLTVRNVEASSRWYQTLLGLTSDHGGPDYERLLADGELVLQLHRNDVAHEHGAIADADQPKENGVLVWFGEVADFDGVVARAQQLGAPMVLAPLRNPPSGTGNGPGHRELWITDPDGYTVVIASPDGEATEI